eukprot:1604072-Amphidinium_carterae.2
MAAFLSARVRTSVVVSTIQFHDCRTSSLAEESHPQLEAAIYQSGPISSGATPGCDSGENTEVQCVALPSSALSPTTFGSSSFNVDLGFKTRRTAQPTNCVSTLTSQLRTELWLEPEILFFTSTTYRKECSYSRSLSGFLSSPRKTNLQMTL